LASLIRDRAASAAAMIAVFGDEALSRAALDFEVALARAESTVSVYRASEIIGTSKTSCEDAAK